MSAAGVAASVSPYVRAHARGPIAWRPWGAEAVDEARRRDRPILLSIGYSTCYWCHAMARESFAAPELARVVGDAFVPVVVDREERPDVDEVYMAATQLLTHRGGWPTTLFLTPGLVPYFAGTYFPPVERGGQPGFLQVAGSMADAWARRRAEVEEQAAELAPVVARYLEDRGEPAATVPSADAVDAAVAALAARFDAEHGGFGRAPKFPPHASLLLLAERADSGAGADAERMLDATLGAMARGGVHDQLAGGFHRYAADREWRVPHFEKPLADNALLLEVYARRAATGDAEAARVARGVAAFVAEELATPDGAFATAVSADSAPAEGGREGAYHAWTGDELRAVLGAEDLAFLAPLLGFDGPPTFEGAYHVLHLPRPMAEQAARRRVAPEALWAEVEPLRRRLLAERRRRQPPWVDPKVLADANGMAVAALATAGRLLGEPAWVEGAAAAAAFVVERLRTPAGLRHVWEGDRTAVGAVLADYAHLVRGLVALADAGDRRWLPAAAELAAEAAERLADGRGGYHTAAPDPLLVWRARDVYDGALPAANAVMAAALVDLGRATGDPRWHAAAVAVLRAFGGVLERQPEAARGLAWAAHRFHGVGG